jgi:8-oxo-dGTP pyrophosphatase MutT (NUDIX family)
VTVGVILLDELTQTVLQIHHVALGQWLFPGGNLEPSDQNLLEAALRELREETGICVEEPSSTQIIDIDRHRIPANPLKHEPEHDHFDFRYLIACKTRPPITLQVEEVRDSRWIPISQVVPAELRKKITSSKTS